MVLLSQMVALDVQKLTTLVSAAAKMSLKVVSVPWWVGRSTPNTMQLSRSWIQHCDSASGRGIASDLYATASSLSRGDGREIQRHGAMTRPIRGPRKKKRETSQ